MVSLALEHVREPADVAAEWDALAHASRNIFATREFLELWRASFARDRQLLLRVCRDQESGCAVGILPLYRWRRSPLSIVRFLGHGAGDELGPVCAASDATRVAEALRRALAAEAPRVFLGERLAANWVAAFPGARTIVSEGNPVIRLTDGGLDAYLAGRSANFRQQLRRRERRLEREHELSYRPLSPDSFERDFDLFVSLHALRWGRRTAFLRDVTFHREFARVALERGWLRVWFLQLGEAPVAAWYGFRFAGVECYYQAGRDPAWDHASVGLVLLAHTVREAFSDGLDEYRLLRGGEGYKYRFTDEDRGLETFAVSRGPLGAGAVRAAELAWAVRRRVAPAAGPPKRALRVPKA